MSSVLYILFDHRFCVLTTRENDTSITIDPSSLSRSETLFLFFFLSWCCSHSRFSRLSFALSFHLYQSHILFVMHWNDFLVPCILHSLALSSSLSSISYYSPNPAKSLFLPLSHHLSHCPLLSNFFLPF